MRFFEPKDYEIICEWWKEYDYPIVPLDCLPKNGLIIENLCAGFLYSTDSALCWLEFVVGNPKATKEERSKGLDELIEGLVVLAKTKEFKYALASVEHPNLKDKVKKLGFMETNTCMSNFVRSL